MQYNEAKKCAESLLLSPSESSSSDSVSLIASALSLIIQTARFVEEKAQNDPSLGKLSLAIFAKTRKESSYPVDTFRLWGPRLKSAETTGSTIEAHPSDPSAANRNSSVTISPAHPRIDSKGILSPSVPSGHDNSGTILNRDDQTKGMSSGSDFRQTIAIQPIFQIENKTYARCLSLFSDACGVTSHISCHLNSFDQQIPRQILVNALRQVLTDFKRHNGIQTNIRYSSILPTELRGKTVHYSSLALYRNTQGYIVLNNAQKVTLNMQKPDRNKKHFNFLVCAALLQADPNGICSEVLKKLSKEGLGGSGCANKPGKVCGGPSACLEISELPECEFFNESNTQVGKGTVHVFPSYFAGLKIRTDSVLVNVVSTSRRTTPTGFMTWKLDQISRHDLLDPFQSVVGSAVLAVTEVYKSGSENPLIHPAMDISNAAVVCDIRIEKNQTSSMYGFSEWYRFGTKSKVDLPFQNENPPSNLLEFGNRFAGFWSKRLVRPQN